MLRDLTSVVVWGVILVLLMLVTPIVVIGIVKGRQR